MTESGEAGRTCALCGSPGRVLHRMLGDRHFDSESERSEGWALRRCSACSLVWIDPLPGAATTSGLYDSYYTHEEAREESVLVRSVTRGIPAARMGYPEPRSSGPALRLLAQLLSLIGPLREVAEHAVMWLPVSRRGRLLDVGCGSGLFLERMRGFGWQVTGVETNPRARAVATRRLGAGAPIFADLSDAALAPGSFDAITLSHVIEHVEDPMETLRRCATLLSPGGLLVCVTPNTASLGARSFGASWLHWDPPRHLHVFDPETLERAVSEAGLEIQQSSTPSSTAHFVWQASTLLERRGRLPGVRISGVSPALFVESVAFWALEWAMTRLGRPVGEEVLVVGQKAPA